MLVRSKRYPNITVVDGSNAYSFINGICDMPREFAVKLVANPDYELLKEPIKADPVEIEQPVLTVDLSIIMLTYNALEYTKKAISAVRKHTPGNYELIVIDNNSTDGTQAWLRKQKLTRLILNKKNLGVAGGRNQGIKIATREIVCFLDNDTEVGEDWTRPLAENFQDPETGIVSKDGARVLTLKPVQFAPPDLVNGRELVDVGVGFCLAVRRMLFEMIGHFYTRFPFPKFWHEDLEFGLRAKLAGYKIVKADIPVIHYKHKSMGEEVDNQKSLELTPGFNENAAHILELYRDRNVLTVYRNWGGFDASSSYDRYTKGLIPPLRDLGMIVIRKPSITTDCQSFDLCKGFEMLYSQSRMVVLHQENDLCPLSWQKALEGVDYIFPASGHVKEVCKLQPFAHKLLSQGIGGIEGDVYKFDVKPYNPFPDVRDNDFKLLMVSANQPRKNTLNLLKWYAEAFNGNSKTVLIIKDGDYGQSCTTREYIGQLMRKPGCPKIRYLSQSLSSEQLAGLYKFTANNGAYVHPHRAEALGLPVLEAIACGCRVGVTGWGGPKFTTSGLKTVEYFNYRLTKSSFHNWPGEPFYSKGQDPRWAEPYGGSVKNFMLSVFKNKYDPEAARESSLEILKRYDYRNVAQQIHKILLELHEKN